MGIVPVFHGVGSGSIPGREGQSARRAGSNWGLGHPGWIQGRVETVGIGRSGEHPRLCRGRLGVELGSDRGRCLVQGRFGVHLGGGPGSNRGRAELDLRVDFVVEVGVDPALNSVCRFRTREISRGSSRVRARIRDPGPGSWLRSGIRASRSGAAPVSAQLRLPSLPGDLGARSWAGAPCATRRLARLAAAAAALAELRCSPGAQAAVELLSGGAPEASAEDPARRDTSAPPQTRSQVDTEIDTEGRPNRHRHRHRHRPRIDLKANPPPPNSWFHPLTPDRPQTRPLRPRSATPSRPRIPPCSTSPGRV